jgi:hypothetical protein
MRLTNRDVQLIRDIGLSHLLSRDQVIQLGYFNSITRANTRLRCLTAERFVTALSTPFHAQKLYAPGPLAEEVVGERIGPLLVNRVGSPRFVQHALSVSNIRIALLSRGAKSWRFEQQLWRNVAGHTLKPDGLVLTSTLPAFIECDLGHVSPAKFKEKLSTFKFLAQGGRCQELYGFPSFRLIVITTGPRRSRSLRSLLPPNAGFEYLVQTFAELDIPAVGGWS